MRVLPRHPGALGVAFLLACLLWYVQALERRERVSERQIDAPVTFVNVPQDMAITSEVPRTLTVRVKGPLSRLQNLDVAQTGVVLDLGDAREAEQEIVVQGRDVSLPAGVEVLAVSPPGVPVRLERIVRRRVEVRARVTGEPAKGLVVGQALTEPASALVSGPRLMLEKLSWLATEPVVVDGLSDALDARVAVRPPHPLVRILEPLTVRVVVTLKPSRIESRVRR